MATFYADSQNDYNYLSLIIEECNVHELLNKRVSDAQHKMHEATTELVEIKKSWVYRILRFIIDILGTPSKGPCTKGI